MDFTLIGIDPGHNTGIAFGKKDSGEILTKTLVKVKSMGKSRLFEVADSILESISKHPIEYVAIEDYAYGNKFFNIEVPELVGMLLYLLSKHKPGIKVTFIPPSTVKKFISGSGKAKKQDVQKAIKEQFDEDGIATVHEYDAIAILETFKQVFDPNTPKDIMRKFAARTLVL